jgi:hypothetical protein
MNTYELIKSTLIFIAEFKEQFEEMKGLDRGFVARSSPDRKQRKGDRAGALQ